MKTDGVNQTLSNLFVNHLQFLERVILRFSNTPPQGYDYWSWCMILTHLTKFIFKVSGMILNKLFSNSIFNIVKFGIFPTPHHARYFIRFWIWNIDINDG